MRANTSRRGAVVLLFGLSLAASCAQNKTGGGFGGDDGSTDVTSTSAYSSTTYASTTVTSTSVTSTSVTTTTVSSTAQSTVASTSIASTSVASTSIASTSIASSSSGTSACDNTGDCAGCEQCAVMGDCAAAYDECFNSNFDCADLDTCLGGCNGDQTCAQGCFTQYPNGESDHDALIVCALCDDCYNDCDGAASGC